MIDLLTLLIFYLILIFSIIGYGKLFLVFIKSEHNIGYQGLIGILFLIIISYITNFFSLHNYIHNTIVIAVGFINFIISLKNNFKNSAKDLKVVLLIFGILFIGLLMYKNHDDFFTYHFPYSLSLVNFVKIIGIGHITSGFTTPSSIFYLNSLFYLPFIEYYLMNSGAIFIMGFSNIIFYNYIKNNIKKNNFLLFLSLFSLIFVNTVFSRMAEHGTDRSALILVFVLALVFLESINLNKKFINSKNIVINFEKIALLITLIISLKSFYLIYISFIFLWFYYFKNKLLNKDIVFKILNNRFFYFSFIGIVLFILTVFLNTGCMVFPASFTCYEAVEWSFNKDLVKSYKAWFEQWSKAGATPNFRVENPELYISYFNWLPGWIDRYFFTKVSDFLLVILLIILIFIFMFSYKKKKLAKGKIKYKLFYFFILILFVEWFINHPALRYGGFTVIALLFFIPISLYLSNFKNEIVYLKRSVDILIILTFIIFTSKNIVRINDEYSKYGYNIFLSAYYYLDKSAFRRDIQIKKIFEENKNLSSNRYLIIKNKIGQ